MAKKSTLRVGNLALTMTETRLQEIFTEFGRVSKARVASSPLSGASRGFGYVELASAEDAAKCLAGLHDQERDGKKLVVVDAPADEVKRYVGRR